MTEAIEEATRLHVDFINISGGGYGFSRREHKAVMAAIEQGIIIVAAAGNDNANLDRYPFYPGCYDKREMVVASTSSTGDKLPSSNYGSQVRFYELGLNVCGAYNICHSGTSQATAVTTGKLIQAEHQRRKLGLKRPSLKR